MSITPSVIAKLTVKGEVTGPNGESLLVCDCCGNIWIDNDDPHFTCEPCGRMFCRMEGTTIHGLMMTRLELMLDQENESK
jgi:hypothetical protein